LGQLGDSTTTDRKLPVQVKGPAGVGFLTGVRGLTGGDLFSAALKADGTVWTWGRNLEGQLGDTTTVRKTTPVQVKGPAGTGFLTGVARLSAGGAFALAV
jgi:alpha-tubulin suppressor-like RCC1 family protein